MPYTSSPYQHCIQLAAWALLSTSLGLALPAHAAGSATIAADHQKAFQIEWLDTNTVRMGEQNASEYMVLRDGKAYMVQAGSDEGRVIEIGDMMRTLGQVAKGLKQPGLDITGRIPQIEAIQNTGKPVTIAGIRGETYTMTVREQNKPPETLTVVLTGNPTVTELSQAYINTAKVMAGTQAIQDIQDALPTDRRGILQVKGKYEVQSISDKKPDPARFVLPGTPTDMNSMLQGLAKQLQKMN